MFRAVARFVLGIMILGFIGNASLYAADEVWLKPFVLGNAPAGSMEQAVATVKSALKTQGFEEAGSY